MLDSKTRTDSALQRAARGGALRAVQRRLNDSARILFGPTEEATQKQDVIRRAGIATVVMATIPIQSLRIPGWEAVLAACVACILYDILLAYLVFARKQYMLERVLGTVLDSILLMGATLYVFHEMALAQGSSDIWLVYVVYIVTGGFTLAPTGSLLYTALWTGWLALATLLYFPAGSQYRDELGLRLVFLCLFGLISLAMAGELAKRRARLEQQNRQTMGMLATLVEARDTDAGAHLHHIQHFSKALALKLGFSTAEADEIAYASMVHDIGKANVPDAVLKKPGPLSVGERLVMQEHTVKGEQLLIENSDFENARQVARWHHEHWDGSGYPDGLAGSGIPLAARIVAVADVFDALISKRPYKEAWPALEAMRELQRLAGSHLDPELVGAFGELWDEGKVQLIIQEITAHGYGEKAPLGKAA
ncbi:MAG: HD domain-containing phosphohydrolase [Dehalococcoidia bacterium]